jgi:hypothetical protein
MSQWSDLDETYLDIFGERPDLGERPGEGPGAA